MPGLHPGDYTRARSFSPRPHIEIQAGVLVSCEDGFIDVIVVQLDQRGQTISGTAQKVIIYLTNQATLGRLKTA